MYPDRRHPEFMAWMLEKAKEGPRPCDGCDRWRTLDRAHLIAEGSAGDDIGNVVLLCRICHDRQEKRTDAFIAETGRDLCARAAGYAAIFLRSRLTVDPPHRAPTGLP